MVYYTKGNSKHGEIIKAEFDLCTSKNTRGQRVDYKGNNEREPGQRHSNKNYHKPDRTKDNIFLKPKDDRTYGERVDECWRLDTGELKRFERRVSRWWKQRYNLGLYHQGKRRNANEALKECSRGAKGNVCMKRILSQWSTGRGQRPTSVLWFCAVDQAGNLSAKDVIGDKENAQDAREIANARKRVPRAKFARLGRESQFNGLDQKLYERWPRPSYEREDKLVDREDYVEDQEIKFENKEELNQLKETLEAKENEIRARERQAEKDEDGIRFDRDALMDKEQRLAERAFKNCVEQERGYRGDGS